MKFKDLKDGQEFMYPGWDCVLFKDGDKALEEDDFYGDSDDDDYFVYIDFNPDDEVFV